MKKILLVLSIIGLILMGPVVHSAFSDEWNWKKFSDYVYLNTDKIEYYTDETGYNHAIVFQKHFQKKGDKYDDRMIEICKEHYKKQLGYILVIDDININKKTVTLSYIIFFDTKGNKLGAIEMGKVEDCKSIAPSTIEDDIYQYVVNSKGRRGDSK